MELKDKLIKENPTAASNNGTTLLSVPETGSRGKLGEAMDALLVLGYSRAEAMTALKDIDVEKNDLEEIIRLSLKKLMKY